MTIMNKKNLILLVVLSNFAFAFGQDFNYFHNLTEQLQYSDCIAYKFYDYNSNSIDYSQGSLFRIPKNEDNSNFFAILGKGFVKIKSIETGKEYYTRAGHILFDEDYNLLLMPGFEFYHNDSKKSINKIEISREGLLTIFFIDNTIQEIKIKVFMPTKECDIKCYGNRYYFSDVQEMEQESEFFQGFVEMSNVNKIGVLLEIQSLLLKMAEKNEISHIVYEYNFLLCKELFVLYSTSVEYDLSISFSEQAFESLKLVEAKEILQRFILK